MQVIHTRAPQKLLVELASSKVIRSDQVNLCRAYLKQNPQATSDALGQFLLNEGALTPYQVEQLVEGNVDRLIFPSYILLDVIGKGSLGNVFKVRRLENDQTYVIKQVSERNKENIAKFSAELQSFSQFRSRAIVPLVHLFAHRGKICLVWPYVDPQQCGHTLTRLVEESGKLSPKETVQIVLQVVKALCTVHQKGLFHGTLHPSNLSVSPKRAVRVLDFGIGFLLSVGRQESLLDTMTHASQIASHLNCSSPETINDTTVRAPAGDQYSIGCILHYCLTGQFPFHEANPVKKMLAHQFDPPTPVRELNPDVPKSLEAMILRLLEKEPEDRYPATEDLLADLEAICKPARPPAKPASATVSQPPARSPVAPPQSPTTSPSGTAPSAMEKLIYGSKESKEVAPVPEPPKPSKAVAPSAKLMGKGPLTSPVLWGGVVVGVFLLSLLAYALL